MEEVIKIEGKHALKGIVRISDSKNATVALIPAVILANGPVIICGVPEISGAQSLSVLLRDLGVLMDIRPSDTIVINPASTENHPLVQDAISKLRVSYYFMGVLLGKYGHMEIKMSGGCYPGPRPIDLHLKGPEALGVKIRYDHGSCILDAPQLAEIKILLDIASVGATINIMTAAVHVKGRTTIGNATKEPEIIDVAALLNKVGANIRGAGTDVIAIDGAGQLIGRFHETIPDRIETVTYIVLATAIARKVRIDNIIPYHLEALPSKLEEIGTDSEIGVDNVVIRVSRDLKAAGIKTLPYPGFATDTQQPLTTLLTQAQGQSIVTGTIHAERFKHCQGLNKMRAGINVMMPSSFINGSAPLSGAEVYVTDLRCGAYPVIAGLTADSVTTIHNIYHIERGYEHIDEKLTTLGAKIWREAIEQTKRKVVDNDNSFLDS